MKYFLLNKDCNEKPEAIKMNRKIEKIVQRMSKLSRKHSELDRQLVSELAKCNNISEDEASDIMAFNDFLVDSAQYGNGLLLDEITKEEYDKIKKANE